MALYLGKGFDSKSKTLGSYCKQIVRASGENPRLPLVIDESLQVSFPGLEVLEIKIDSLRIKDRDERLEAFKSQVQQKVRESFGSPEQIRDQIIFRAYRDFFWRVGIDPTKTRPASEALTRRIVAGKSLPTINTLVDSYNLASVETFVAIAAFDLDLISESLFMRKARERTFSGHRDGSRNRVERS